MRVMLNEARLTERYTKHVGTHKSIATAPENSISRSDVGLSSQHERAANQLSIRSSASRFASCVGSE